MELPLWFYPVITLQIGALICCIQGAYYAWKDLKRIHERLPPIPGISMGYMSGMIDAGFFQNRRDEQS